MSRQGKRCSGYIKTFSPVTGWGFIITEAVNRDVFFHLNSLDCDPPKERLDQSKGKSYEVEFELDLSERHKPKALGVKIYHRPEGAGDWRNASPPAPDRRGERRGVTLSLRPRSAGPVREGRPRAPPPPPPLARPAGSGGGGSGSCDRLYGESHTRNGSRSRLSSDGRQAEMIRKLESLRRAVADFGSEATSSLGSSAGRRQPPAPPPTSNASRRSGHVELRSAGPRGGGADRSPLPRSGTLRTAGGRGDGSSAGSVASPLRSQSRREGNSRLLRSRSRSRGASGVARPDSRSRGALPRRSGHCAERGGGHYAERGGGRLEVGRGGDAEDLLPPPRERRRRSPLPAAPAAQSSPSAPSRQRDRKDARPASERPLWSGIVNKFKVLLPSDSVAQAFGRLVAELEAETGAELEVSYDRHQGTGCRVLDVKARSGRQLRDVLERVLEELDTSVEMNGNSKMRLQLLLPRPTASTLIGEGGSTIKALRRETNTHIHVDAGDGYDTEQVVNINGIIADVMDVLARLHSFMQDTQDKDEIEDDCGAGGGIRKSSRTADAHDEDRGSVKKRDVYSLHGDDDGFDDPSADERLDSGRPATPPPPWKLEEHPEAPGEWYYLNEETGETSWDPPKNSGDSRRRAPGRPATPPPPWRVEEHPKAPGEWYYVNEETLETTWDRPDEVGASANSDAVDVDVDDDGAPAANEELGGSINSRKRDANGGEHERLRLKRGTRRAVARGASRPLDVTGLLDEGEAPADNVRLRRRRKVVKARGSDARRVEGLPAPWVKLEHPEEAGSFYYLNEETGQTSWEMPDAI